MYELVKFTDLSMTGFGRTAVFAKGRARSERGIRGNVVAEGDDVIHG